MGGLGIPGHFWIDPGLYIICAGSKIASRQYRYHVQLCKPDHRGHFRLDYPEGEHYILDDRWINIDFIRRDRGFQSSCTGSSFTLRYFILVRLLMTAEAVY